MAISAKQTKQTISLVGDVALSYKEGRPLVRKYEACFYEINAATDETDLFTDE
jgi:hypothetical protein